MEPFVVKKLKFHKFPNASEPRRAMSGYYDKIHFSCESLLPVLGGYHTPAKKGDAVIFWYNKNSYKAEWYCSLAKNKSMWMGIPWSVQILGDTSTHAPIIRIQNMATIINPCEYRLVGVRISDIYNNTVQIKGIGGTMNKLFALWDYTSLDIKVQLEILETLIKWHTAEKGCIRIWKPRGGALIETHVDIIKINQFVEENYLKGKIWFIRGSHPAPNWEYSLLSYGPQLVDANMTIYSSIQFEEMIKRFKGEDI